MHTRNAMADVILLVILILYIMPICSTSPITPNIIETSEMERLRAAAMALPAYKRGIRSATSQSAPSRKQRDLLQQLVAEFQTNCSADPTNADSSDCLELLSEIIQVNGMIPTKLLREQSNNYACGGTPPALYRPDQHICCNGVLHNRTSDDLQCCNNTLLEPKNQFCCKNQLHANAADGSLQCCGTFVYNKSREICCEEKLHNRTRTSACCYDSVYDREHEVCCQGKVSYDRKKKCCGSKAYDKKMEACCNGDLFPAFGNNNKHGHCCAYKNIDLRCFTCENNTKMEIQNTTLLLCDRYKTTTYTSVAGFVTMTPFEKTTASDISPSVVISACGGFLMTATALTIYLRKKNNTCVKSSKSNSSQAYLVGISNSSDITLNEKMITVNNNLNEPPTTSVPYCDRQSVQSVSRTSMKSTLVMLPQDCWSSDPSFMYPYEDCEASVNTPLRNFNVNDLAKSQTTQPVNLLNMHFVNAQTQTTESKRSNKQTVFGKRFEHSRILDGENNTFQIPGSDVKVIFPISLTKNYGIEVQGATFRGISDIRKRFCLPISEAVASPVTEYHVTGCAKFPDYACVKMPFVGPTSKLKVWKFLSDEGITQTTARLQVPLKGKDNHEQLQDMFYEVEGSTCLVYTRSFSGFFCTTDGHRPLKLRAFVYASYKRFLPTIPRPRHEVRIRMYIADEIMKFKDFKQTMDDNEMRAGRVQKEDKVLNLLDELTQDDNLIAYVTPTEDSDSQWMHKTNPNNNEPIFPEMQKLPLENIVQPCPDCPDCHFQSSELPYCLEWFLTNRPGELPPLSFQGLVTVDSVMDNTPQRQSTALIIDELPLRPEDRFPAEEIDVAERLHHIKAVVANMPADKQQRLLEFFGHGLGFVNKLFEDLELRYKPAGVFHRLHEAFSKQHLYEELDALYKRGLIPPQYCPRPIQRVEHSNVPERSPIPFTHPTDTPVTHDNPIRTPPPRYERQSNRPCHPETRGASGVSIGGEFMRPLTESSLFKEDDNTAENVNQSAAVGTDDVYESIVDQELEPLRKALSELGTVPIQENASLDETLVKKEADSGDKIY